MLNTYLNNELFEEDIQEFLGTFCYDLGSNDLIKLSKYLERKKNEEEKKKAFLSQNPENYLPFMEEGEAKESVRDYINHYINKNNMEVIREEVEKDQNIILENKILNGLIIEEIEEKTKKKQRKNVFFRLFQNIRLFIYRMLPKATSHKPII